MSMRRAALLAVVLATGGCFWLQGESHETTSLPDQKPRNDVRRPPTQPSADSPLAEPSVPTLENTTLPEVTSANWRELLPEYSLWAGGLRTAAIQFNGPIAFLDVTVVHRRIEGPSSVLALLTAQLVAEAPRDGGTKPSLHRRIVDLGGDLEVEVGLARTSFAVTVPIGRIDRALAAFAECLQEAPTTSERVDTFRGRIVREITATWAARPLDTAVDRVLSIELRGLGDWLARLEDATAIDVGLFHRENYTPDRMLISLASDRNSGEGTNALIAAAFEPWLSRKPAALPQMVALPPAASGAFWSPAPMQPRFAVVLELPPPHVPDAALLSVAAEYLGGPGGVVERAVRSVLPDVQRLERRIRTDGVRRFLQIEFATPEDQVAAVWNAIRDAYTDTARKKPGLQELTAAAARARVALGEQLREPRALVDLGTRAGIIGALPTHIVGADGKELSKAEASEAWRASIHRLDQPETLDLGPTLTTLAERKPLCVILGGDPATSPTQGFFVAVPDAILPESRRAAVSADLVAQETEAAKYMTLAVRAVSGGIPAIVVGGVASRSITRSGRGPEVADIEWFHSDGRFRRVRYVLATTIEVVIGKNGATERCGAETRRPDPDEVASTLAPLRRHPLLLLSEWSAGKSKYRLVSKREHDGRELAVLERMNDGGEPLRLMVDAETGLPRVVTYHEDRPNGRVYVRDEWRDYRDIGSGVRAPHHRTTFFDDGNHGLVTTWSDFAAIAPSAELLTPGGPLR
ncbi:MAG: hypothetical protein U1F36_13625 [Planctomycetota bacterium]